MSRGPRRRRRAARIILAVLCLVAVAVVAAWAWLESDGAARRLRVWLEERGTEILGRQVGIGALELDVVPFRLDLDDVRIADDRPGEPPFLRVDGVQVRVQPWALLAGRAVIDSLILERPVLHLDLLEDGGTNAPSPPETRGGGGISVELNRLDVLGGRLEINHRPTRIQAELAGVALEFTRSGLASVARGADIDEAHGRIAIEDGELQMERPAPSGGTELALSPVRLDVTFTVAPEEIGVDDLSVRVGGNRAVGTGTVRRWDRADFRLDARLDLEEVDGAWPLPGPGDYRGEVAYSGDVTWADGGLRLDGTVRSGESTLAGLEVRGLEAGLNLSPERIEVVGIRTAVLEGRASGEVAVDRGEEGGWRIDYRLEEIDLDRLTSWRPLRGLRFSGTADVSGTVRWRTPWRSTLTGEGRAALRMPVSLPSAEAEGPAPVAGGGPSKARSETQADTASPVAGREGDREPGPPGKAPAPLLPLPLTAELSHSVADGVVEVRDARVRLRSTEITADGSVDLDGNASLDVAVETDDLRTIDILASQIRRMLETDETADAIRLGLRGAARLTGTLSGPIADPTLRGRVRGNGLEAAGLELGELQGDVAYRLPRLRLDRFEIRRGGGFARGEGTFRLGGETGALPADYVVDLALDEYPLTAELPTGSAGRRLVVDGRVSGTVELQGAYDGRPRGTLDVRTGGLQVAGLPPLEVAARAELSAEVWEFERLRLAPVDGEGQVVGRGGWRPASGTVDGSLTFEELVVDRFPPVPGLGDLGGRISGEASVSGALPLPDGSATLRWSDATVRGTGIGSVVAALRIGDGRLAIRALGAGGPGVEVEALPPPSTPAAPGETEEHLEAPTLPTGRQGLLAVSGLLRLPIEGAGLAGTRSRGAVRLEAPPELLSLVLEIAGIGLPPSVAVDGALTARGEGPFGSWEEWRGEATLSDLELRLERVTLGAPRPLEAELEGRILSVRLPELETEQGTMSVRAVVDLAEARWREAEISGAVDLAIVRLWRPEWQISGFGRGTVRMSGPLSKPDVRGALTLDEGALAHPRLPWAVTGVRGELGFEGDRIRLQDVRGSVADRPFTATGSLPFAALAERGTGEPVSLDLEIEELPLGPLMERTESAGEFLTGGRVSASISIRGRGLDWRGYGGDVELRELTLRMSRYEIELVSASRLTLADGSLRVPESRFRGAGSSFTVQGSVDLATRRLDLGARGDVDLDPLNTLSEDWGVAGLANVDLRVRGEIPDLFYEGTVEIRDGLLNALPLRQPVEEVQARLLLDGRRLAIESLTGQLGGGELEADGEMLLRGSRPESFRITLDLEEVVLRLEREVRLTASGDLVYEGTVEQSLLTGTIAVDEGVYGREWTPGEPLLEMMAGPEIENPFLDTVNLDLYLEVPRNLRMDNNIAQMEMRADLNVRGTLEEPVLLGRAEVLEGEIFWQGNTYRVIQGVVEFNNPLETEPVFDIRAETTMRQYTITLNFSGSFDKGVQFTYSSNPPLSDLDLVGLLALGRPPEQRDTETGLGASVGLQATRYLTAQYFAEVERGAQRVFGIDRFRIEPSLQGQRADPTARLTLGEQITSNLFVTYSTLLGTSEEQLVTIEYQLTRSIRITGIREEDGSLGLDVHFDFRF